MTTTLKQDEIIEMAIQARIKSDTAEYYKDELEAFAKLVEERTVAKATDEANARSNASWALMCKKMVEQEREACAKVCEHTALRMGSEWMAQHCAEAIRARAQAERGEQHE